MIARMYGKLDRRHEPIAPFLPVRMRTGLIIGLEIFVQKLVCLNRPSLRGVINRDPKSDLNRYRLEYVPPYGKSSFRRHWYRRETSYLELSTLRRFSESERT
jgi:hypothetical protein